MSASEVVARVDGRAVHEDELRMAARTRPGSQRVDWADALESYVAAEIIRDEFRHRALDQTDTYRERIGIIEARAWRSEQELARDVLLEDIDAELTFSEDELRARYDDQRDRFRSTRLHLRQITVPDRETIRKIHGRIVRGEEFARIAAEANLDPALRRASGDLGWIPQRKMPTALIGPAHQLLESGQFSEPFEDREGRWNLVQLIARDEGVARAFEDVEHQLEREMRIVRSREILAELVAERREGVAASLEASR
jgi:parvulin-like peptidyl-prolyl isomerase